MVFPYILIVNPVHPGPRARSPCRPLASRKNAPSGQTQRARYVQGARVWFWCLGFSWVVYVGVRLEFRIGGKYAFLTWVGADAFLVACMLKYKRLQIMKSACGLHTQ